MRALWATRRAGLAEATLELVQRHAPAALRLHLEDLEPVVVEPRAPDDHRAAMQLSARANVRRERPDPVVQLFRRPGPVEQAVLRSDLLGVRDLPVLRTELGCLRLLEEIWREVCGPAVHGAGVVIGLDPKG